MADVIWNDSAKHDLQAIYKRIARDSITTADKWYHRIVAAANALMLFPEIGSPVDEMTNDSFREQIVGTFRIIYRFDDSTCHIHNELRAERDLERYFASLDLT